MKRQVEQAAVEAVVALLAHRRVGRQRDRREAELELGREALADVVARPPSRSRPAAGRTSVAVSPPKGWSSASSAGTAPLPAPRAVHSWR